MNWGVGALLGALMGWLILRIADSPQFTDHAVGTGQQKPPHHLPDVGSVVISVVLFAYLAASGKQLGETLAYMVISAFLLLIATLDLRYRIVPNVLVYPAAGALLLGRLLHFGVEDVMIALCSGVGSFAFFMLVATISPGGLGGGDIKLAALVGLLVGFPSVLWALVLAILTGGITAIVMLFTGRRGSMPYAPYLCLGAWVALFWDPLPWLLEFAQAAAG